MREDVKQAVQCLHDYRYLGLARWIYCPLDDEGRGMVYGMIPGAGTIPFHPDDAIKIAQELLSAPEKPSA